MNLTALQMALRRAGIWLTKGEDGKLQVSPASKMTPELRAAVKEHKAALMDEIELGWRQEWEAIEPTL